VLPVALAILLATLPVGLPDLNYKNNRITCNTINTIMKAVKAKPSTKFVMKITTGPTTGDFAVSCPHFANFYLAHHTASLALRLHWTPHQWGHHEHHYYAEMLHAIWQRKSCLGH
jgi:hypothetical protein